jgi:hypothetical protein
MAEWITPATINEAGPAADGSETSAPVIYVNISSAQIPTGQWFYASENARSEILAVALSAMLSRRSVAVSVDPPNTAGTPYTEIYRMYLLSS